MSYIVAYKESQDSAPMAPVRNKRQTRVPSGRKSSVQRFTSTTLLILSISTVLSFTFSFSILLLNAFSSPSLFTCLPPPPLSLYLSLSLLAFPSLYLALCSIFRLFHIYGNLLCWIIALHGKIWLYPNAI